MCATCCVCPPPAGTKGSIRIRGPLPLSVALPNSVKQGLNSIFEDRQRQATEDERYDERERRGLNAQLDGQTTGQVDGQGVDVNPGAGVNAAGGGGGCVVGRGAGPSTVWGEGSLAASPIFEDEGRSEGAPGFSAALGAPSVSALQAQPVGDLIQFSASEEMPRGAGAVDSGRDETGTTGQGVLEDEEGTYQDGVQYSLEHAAAAPLPESTAQGSSGAGGGSAGAGSSSGTGRTAALPGPRSGSGALVPSPPAALTLLQASPHTARPSTHNFALLLL